MGHPFMALPFANVIASEAKQSKIGSRTLLLDRHGGFAASR